MKRTVGVADCRHALGEAVGRHAMKRAALLARHEEGCSNEGLQACYRKDKEKARFKGDAEVADYRHAVGEAGEKHAIKRAVIVADCRQACCRRGMP
jgi:hypothetical protein